MSKLRINIFSIATTLNYFWSSVVGVVKVDYFDLQLLAFWIFFPIFSAQTRFFLTKSRKIYGCFFHSFCVNNFNFGSKNNGRMK